MEEYFKRYFWIVGPLAVVLCAVFAARGVAHVLEAKFLGDSETPPKPPPLVKKAAKPGKSRSKSGEPLAARNMFCSECLPPDPVEDDTGPQGPGVPNTSLPLRVVATNVSSEEKYSFATIQNTESEARGSYGIEEMIPSAGKVVRIRGKYVDFRNSSSQRVERIQLLGKDAPTPAVAATAPVARPTSPRNEVAQMIDDGVKKDGENSWEVKRSLVDKILENPALVARGARIVPSIRNGKPNGFKLYAIRPNSIYAKIGLMNGDTINAINGFELTTADKALEVYTKVREANNLTVNLTRRGKPLTNTISIR